MKHWRVAFLLGVVLGGDRLLADPSPVSLVKDINAEPGSAFGMGTSIAELGGVLYFSAATPENSYSLWRSDGTAAGTQLVKTIDGPSFGIVRGPVVVNGTLVFRAEDGAHGSELWKSDGTSAGTMLLKDIAPGLVPGSYPQPVGSFPDSFVILNDTLYFIANDGVNGPAVWKSDGTAAGTVMVKDISSGTTIDSAPWPFIVSNGALFFAAYGSGFQGRELWKSDGTSAGTVLVKDIAPGITPSFSPPAYGLNGADVNGTLFFTANDGTHGAELWKSDGTSAGTVLVKDIRPGSLSSILAELTNVNGTLYFTADDGTYGAELWKSDGTSAGTVMVMDVVPGSAGSSPIELTNVNGTLFFTEQSSGALWKSDGTATGTVVLSPSLLAPQRLIDLNGTLIFTGTDPLTSGRELWQSDGTPAGTMLLKDILPGSGSSNPGTLSNVNGTLYFAARSVAGASSQLWKSDGTSAGTVAVTNFASTANSIPAKLTDVGGTLFFTATDGLTGTELWKSDGSSVGTALVKDILPGATGSSPVSLMPVNDTLFFTVGGTENVEIWKSDGTSAGTQFVTDVLFGCPPCDTPGNLTNVNGTLLFAARDDTYGIELWKSDGTSAGTMMLTEINKQLSHTLPSPPSSPPIPRFSYPQSFTKSFDGTVFFTADDGLSGRELWKSDGTETGTVLVKDIRPGFQQPLPPDPRILATPLSSSPSNLTKVNGTLYFTANDGTHGAELWKSDGTSAGTVLVMDLVPGSGGSSPFELTNVNGTLIFTQLKTTPTQHVELWKSDGTSAGTVLIKDGFLGVPSVAASNFANLNGTLLFTANDGPHGVELWKSDGTTAGTMMVKDIWPGIGSGYDPFPNDRGPITVGSVVVFTADDGVSGTELWVSDGTSAGTRPVAEIAPTGNADPHGFKQIGEWLYFAARTNETNEELFAIPVAALTDADLDGLLDANERALGTDLFVADSDGDGLSDGDEVHAHGTDPLDADSDDDGYPDGVEQLAGTNPLDPLSFPPAVPLSGVWGYAALAAMLLTAARGRPRDVARI